jgi:hypothetical protein
MAMGWQGEWDIFGVHSQCKSETFLVDRNEKHGIGLRTSKVEATYVGRVCVILILKAWQVSKGQPSSTTLNANTSSIYICGFLI